MTYITQLTWKESRFGSRIVVMALVVLGIIAMQSRPVQAQAQSTTNGNNINNTNTGSVGVGTATPTTNFKLDVAGAQVINYSGDSVSSLLINATGNDSSPAFKVMMPATGLQKAFQLANIGNTSGWASFEYNVGATGKPGFALGSGSAVRDTKLYRDSASVLRTNSTMIVDGNFGIGTTAPGAKLQVMSGVTTIGEGLFKLQNSVGSTLISMGDDGMATYRGQLSIYGKQSGGDYERLRIWHTGDNNDAIVFASEAGGTGTLRNIRFSAPTTMYSGILNARAAQVTSATGAANYISFWETNVAFNGAIGFEAGSQSMLFQTGGSGVLNGTTRMTILANGNVGVGTVSPASKLDVSGTVNATGFTLNGGAFTGSQWTPNGANINRSSGNVGIGTASPAAGLDVQNPLTAVTAYGVRFQQALTAGNNNAELNGLFINPNFIDGMAVGVRHNALVTGAGNVGIGTSVTNAGLDVQNIGIAASGTTFGTRFQQVIPAAGNNAISTAVYINPNFSDGQAIGVRHNALVTGVGNIGIGTSTPGAGLDVQNVGIAVSGSTFGTRFQQVIPSAGNNAISTAVYINPNFSDGQAVGVRHNGLVVASGDVGIGTSTPMAKLDVNGTVNATGLTVNGTAVTGSQWANSGNNIKYTLGNVGIGSANPTVALDVTGDIKVSGNINAKYQDLAEWVESSQTLAAGTVVVLDHTRSNQVIASSQAYDTRVAGVISLQPGIALGESGAGKVLVATTGRVKIKVDATAGAIQIGDLLVTSDKEGIAKKSEPLSLGGVQIHRPGTLIGKALEPLAKGTGEILVLLSLQ